MILQFHLFGQRFFSILFEVLFASSTISEIDILFIYNIGRLCLVRLVSSNNLIIALAKMSKIR
jgi:hypothetical protein